MAERSQGPSDLEREIVQAREELAQSVDAIVDRVHPKKVARRGMHRMKERLGLGNNSADRARALDLSAAATAGELGRGAAELSSSSAALAGRTVGDVDPGSSLGSRSGIRREYLLAAGAVLVAGTVAYLVYRRRRS